MSRNVATSMKDCLRILRFKGNGTGTCCCHWDKAFIYILITDGAIDIPVPFPLWSVYY